MLGVIVQPKELCDEKHCPFNALRFNSRQIGEKPTYDLPTSEVGIPWTIGTKMATFDSWSSLLNGQANKWRRSMKWHPTSSTAQSIFFVQLAFVCLLFAMP